MTRKTFIKKLMSNLKNISEQERIEIKKFYEEMFDEANIDYLDEVPESFGDPRKIAMEILKDSIEFDNEKKSDKKLKFKKFIDIKDSLFKKISLIFLGLLSLPLLLPIVIFLSVLMILSLAVGVVFLTISIITLPFTIWFFPFLIFKIVIGLFIFCVILFIFCFIVKILYKFFINNISQNPDRYINRYFKIRYSDDEIYSEENNGYGQENKMDNEENLKFYAIDKVEGEFEAITVIFESTQLDYVIIDQKNLKKSKIVVERKENTLKIKNKILTNYESEKTVILDKKFVSNNTVVIYIPKGISLSGAFDASNVKFILLENSNFNVTFNASNVRFEDLIVKNSNIEVNASNINGNVDFEKMKLNVSASNVNLETENEKEDIELTYSLTMSKFNFFGNKFTGFGNFSNPKKIDSKAQLTVDCAVSNITIK